jgi:hypothetical protein
MRTYKLYHTQPDRKGVTLDGICQRNDGKHHFILQDGSLYKGLPDEIQKLQIWHYRLTTMGEIDGYADGKKRASSKIYVLDEEDVKTPEDAQQLRKMSSLVNYIKSHPQVAHYEYKRGEKIQVNPNFDAKQNRGLYFVLIDETAIEEADFKLNRKKREAMFELDNIFDKCKEEKDYTLLFDLCYGLNTSVKPYLNTPVVNYNKLEDFINRAPDRFLGFVTRSESKFVILFKKATLGVSTDKEPLIELQNGSYQFNGTILGSNEEEVVYFFKTNPKVVEALENTLSVKRPAKELEEAEVKLAEVVETAVQTPSEVKNSENELNVDALAGDYIDRLVMSRKNEVAFKKNLRMAQKTADNIANLDNKAAFVEAFNRKSDEVQLDVTIKLQE